MIRALFEAIDTSWPLTAIAMIAAFALALLWIFALCRMAARGGESGPRLRLVPPLDEAEKILSRSTETPGSARHPGGN